jgi:hypothetical protein
MNIVEFTKLLDAALHHTRAAHAVRHRSDSENIQSIYDAEAAARQAVIDYVVQSLPEPELAVAFGAMPESNGKANWTAILHRGDIAAGHTLERSEHHDRVRYEADRVRYLIGELKEEPFILDYDADMLSPEGWKHPCDLRDLAKHFAESPNYTAACALVAAEARVAPKTDSRCK